MLFQQKLSLSECGAAVWTGEGSVVGPDASQGPNTHRLLPGCPRVPAFPPPPAEETALWRAGLASMWGCCGAAWTHLWVRGLPALRWDHDIQGAPDHRGDQWTLEAPGAPGGLPGQADRWVLVLTASAGEQLTVRFVLWKQRCGG